MHIPRTYTHSVDVDVFPEFSKLGWVPRKRTFGIVNGAAFYRLDAFL